MVYYIIESISTVIGVMFFPFSCPSPNDPLPRSPGGLVERESVEVRGACAG